MIPNQWYVILESKDVRPGKPVGITRLGEKMVAWRDRNGKVVIQADRCPHLSASLSQGKITNNRIACPFHGFEYDSSGVCQYVPALGITGTIPKALHAKTYKSYEANGLIWIWWGNSEPVPATPWFFNELPAFTYASGRQHWPVHYSRAVENQLDVLHLPFVHHNTIGRANKQVVDGPVVKVEDGMLSVWMYNRLEDGIPARKAWELSEPAVGESPMLQFIFPNIWQLLIANDLRIFAAFIPVDDNNTLFMYRYYQRIMKMPVVKGLVNWLGVLGSRMIVNQDRRVVLEQRPSRTQLKQMGEILTQADKALLVYRQQRDELQNKAIN
ncbi:MAG: aromatic ring-hydroxylating dioxygenase subunit alpha [Dehalococcoidales bacterium]|nr:aromatic ring-hydroxylating dioxygenase subunit alpha [Dehalococcoidales bacterium]